MFTIGDFAALGRVSVRMLRHYDAVGVLRPDRVDPVTGYRYYAAGQLRRLNRLMALKDLGFTLAEVGRIIDAEVGPAELRGMLLLRQAQVAEQLAADRDRLVRIGARLRMIEKEGTMSTSAVTVKPVEPLRLAALSDVAASTTHEDIGPVVGGLFGRVFETLQRAGVRPVAPPVATYAPADGDRLAVTVGCVVAEETVGGLDSVRLDGAEEAACYVHHGRMADIDEGYQTLAAWIEDNGYLTDGTAREVYLVSHPEPEERWRTELQLPITRSARR